jgi:hypothetical protein
MALSLPVTLRAQTPTPEPAPLAAVSAAFTAFAALESYRVSGTWLLDEATTIGDQFVTNSRAYSLEGAVSGGDESLTVHLTATGRVRSGSSVEFGEAALTFERIRVDGVPYLRFTDVEQIAGGLAFDNLPADWFAVTPSALQSLSTQAFATLQGFAGLRFLPTALGYDIDSATVDVITELPRETWEGQSMRVFDVLLNSPAIYITQEPDFPRYLASLGLDANEVTSLFTEDGYLVRFRVWVGVDDAQLHRLDFSSALVIPAEFGEINGQKYGLTQSIDTQLTFSSFGEVEAIRAPDIGR